MIMPDRLIMPDRHCPGMPQVTAVDGQFGTHRICIAADDQFLLPCALEFQPVTRAAADVGRVGALGDQPFPPCTAGVGESALRVAAPRVAEPQGWPRGLLRCAQ